MSFGGPVGDAVASASTGVFATEPGAMPKLPPRLASAKQQRSPIPTSPCGPIGITHGVAHDGTAAATSLLTENGSCAIPEHLQDGPAAANGATTSHTDTAQHSPADGPSISSRPSAGPSLPPRNTAAKPKSTAASTSAANHDTTTQPANFASAMPADGHSVSGGTAVKAAAPTMAGAAPSRGGPTATASSSSAGTSGVGKAGLAGGLSGLPPRPGVSSGPVLDPDEPESLAQVSWALRGGRTAARDAGPSMP